MQQESSQQRRVVAQSAAQFSAGGVRDPSVAILPRATLTAHQAAAKAIIEPPAAEPAVTFIELTDVRVSWARTIRTMPCFNP